MSYKDTHHTFERLGIKHKIAITGLSRTGKSTAADYFSEMYGFYVYDMSDDLKLDYDTESRRTSDAYIDRHGKPREGYQLFGQLKRYVHGEDYWIDKVQRRISGDSFAIENRKYENGEGIRLRNNPHQKVLLTGLRQPNEFEYARANGFTIIRLEVDEDIRIERIKASGEVVDEKTIKHETEATLMNEKVDYVVKNNTNNPENMIDWLDEIAREVINGGRF
ncbi:adenylate kinase [Bacillus phage Megatron]|uniref:Adenylate kinase n=4 Tax=Wphvirus megatron TaxID=1987728 RepID=A0A024B2L7_9CAUD|nr:adenylate kinase [Bacillus phage Megatron]YP_009212002.1 dephospho coA kinase [Bacillus phage Eyuki]YP_009280863.1 dephospho-CoA kinase [Bacillus phage SageFayge]YP_009285002.1 dephospho-CoA kinase [Bacillus phage DirtyBetty]AXQ67555.1 dephospho-CoA kinase [Bacillus phage OmnioDeoPrimus]AHZ10637.1 adenylate kinase [Bacillus phage Megatron]ALA46720.1 dephospho coA kinase [Bacillus phage Eyuki]AMW62980.1 dephospho-CoA kinase [Bacillus phage SageFayge]ANT41446.1 dephospho-CoA kinase [Bacill